MRAAVFIERDGVLADSTTGNGPASTFEEFKVRSEAAGPVQKLREAGFLVFATTNQPGVTSGKPTRRELDLMHATLLRQLSLDEVLVCHHAADDSCGCHKPQPGMLLEAARRHGVDLEHSYVVSDKWIDAEMAEATGSTSVLLRSKHNGTCHHDFVVEDLAGATAKILENAGELGTLRALAARRR